MSSCRARRRAIDDGCSPRPISRTRRSARSSRARSKRADARARLEVLHAIGFLEAEVNFLAALGTPGIPPPPDDYEQPSRTLDASLHRLRIDAQRRVVERPAATAIVGEAEDLDAELVVVGSHGRTGLLRVMLGRTAERVMHAAPCSVLLARPIASESYGGRHAS